MALTNQQYSEIEKAGVIPPEIQAKNPTLHGCLDWDVLLIDETMPEFQIRCGCILRQKGEQL